jgi:glycosyltransferase involved in cell wall biosynthesis
MRGRLEEQVRSAGLAGVTFLGQVDAGRADVEIGSARLLVVPSLWFEGFPLVLREAFARGTPAAVSDLGALPDLVEHGRAGAVFRAGDSAALLEAVRALWQSPGALETRAAEARRTYEAKYSEDRNLAILLGIYQQAIQSRQERPALRGASSA